ncbi:competence protein ComFA [Mesobacillus persicus]|uniref:Competence protein ComFA n=1 Tax=Mesobacillus persicus TaxID=930146 RepID=A0A1H8A451_9BACI|nr:DEAD/DEAH box helicase [Mesobacillus persicus]SEM65286.1 competence protein ComFA [Mesobacillus persicus]
MRFAIEENKLTPAPLLLTPQETYPISKLNLLPEIPLDSTFCFNSQLQHYLSGKQLLLDDLPFTLDDIQLHYVKGYLMYRKGIEIVGDKNHCLRCGTKDSRWFAEFPCARCGDICTYCRQCLMMGRVSSCTPLISWRGPVPEGKVPLNLLEWTGTLSPGQSGASSRVVNAVDRLEQLLVWAVCGAGKTEVLFKGIEHALTQGKRVCIATPRTDVVLELTPRLRAVFPHTTVASLYGGSEDRHTYAPLTIATTHQLLRFYQAFDTLIVDEVDAFPYSIDETLQYAVKQAKKPHSALIFLTATPSRKWQRECHLGKREFVTIPARYHRKPLPVPKFVWCGNWAKLLAQKRLPTNLLVWTKKRLAANKQALIFVPRIEAMDKMLHVFQKLHPQIESVHAEDPDRKEKVMRMRNKEIPVLLTTTILERGVTFANIDVAVLGAEDQVFAESALVQIAGRAGRSAQFPSGEVIFFHYGKTESMVRARNQILAMNKEATQRGMLDK